MFSKNAIATSVKKGCCTVENFISFIFYTHFGQVYGHLGYYTLTHLSVYLDMYVIWEEDKNPWCGQDLVK